MICFGHNRSFLKLRESSMFENQVLWKFQPSRDMFSPVESTKWVNSIAKLPSTTLMSSVDNVMQKEFAVWVGLGLKL